MALTHADLIAPSIFVRDITYEQFTALLKEVAVKYGKDHKIFNADEAYMAMSRAIIACGPSLTGTTVWQH